MNRVMVWQSSTTASAQASVFADPQPGPQQHLDGDTDQHPAAGLGGPEQFRCGGVIESLGQG
jgi:hypothetical protein